MAGPWNKHKPRVAFVLQMFGVGGMPKWIYRLAKALRDDFDFYFIATHSDYFLPKYAEVATLVQLPPKKWQLAAYLAWHRIDVVQMANLRVYAEGALAARVSVVVERTDGIRGGAALGPKHGLDAVIASTQGTIPHIAELIDESKIQLIYNGVDLELYESGVAERFGFADTDILIGRTSRLVGGKNIPLLIRAVIELRKQPQYAHVRLVVCGGDTTQPGTIPILDDLKALAVPLGDSVVFTGEVANPAPITKGYDIATCTSMPNNEGIPNSLLEAMAAGKPLISTDVGDINEIVIDDQTGYLIPNDDADTLVVALKRLVDGKSVV